MMPREAPSHDHQWWKNLHMSDLTETRVMGWRESVVGFVAAVFGIMLATLPASAQDAQRPVLNWDNAYIGFGVGPIIPLDASARLSGTLNGSGKLKFNPAAVLGPFVGYKFTDQVAAEAEVDWSLFDPRTLSGSFSGPGGAFSEIPLNGYLNTVTGLVNGFYRPLGDEARFSPYLGGGLGFATLLWSATSRPNGTIPLAVKGNSTNLAADAMVGLDYRITNKISLGGRYRFLWINANGDSLSGNGVVLTHGDALINEFMATGTYRF
jgi:opacity protein-like surface antigen